MNTVRVFFKPGHICGRLGQSSVLAKGRMQASLNRPRPLASWMLGANFSSRRIDVMRVVKIWKASARSHAFGGDLGLAIDSYTIIQPSSLHTIPLRNSDHAIVVSFV
jgi:hypothetical protein